MPTTPDDDFVEPPEVITQGAIDVTRKNAEWARRFMPSASNLSQRRKYRQDIAADTENQLALREMEDERRAQTSSVAQGFYFKSKELDLKRAKFAHDLQENEKDMEFKERRLASALETDASQRASARALEEQRLLKTKYDADIVRERNEANIAVRTALDQVRKSGVSVNSRAYQEAVAEQLAQNPGVSKEWRDSFVRSANLSEEEMVARIEAIQQRLPKASVTLTPSGEPRISQPGEKPAPASSDPAKEREFWQKERSAQLAISKTLTGAEKDAAIMRMNTAQKKLDQLARGESAPATPGEPASQPAPDERIAVVSPDGRAGRIPRSQLDAAIKAGYRTQ